jgi:ubiquinone/menaquinone biosynthesis C-methylase UbiE
MNSREERGIFVNEKKFDPKKLKKLNNSQRLKDIPVAYILDKLELEQSSVFVDIGAGTAFFSIAFLQQDKPTTIYACDISTTMIDWIKENIVPVYPSIYPVKSEEASVPLEDEIADLIFFINLHHELESPIQTLEEAFRILKVGGKALVIDWKKQDMAEGPPTHIRCVAEEVGNQMEKAGLKHIQISSKLEKHFFVIGQK